MNYQLHHGDCLEILRALPTASVDAVVTDPPYGLSFMGKKWDYDVPSVAIWAECLRVLKPGAHLLAFAGTRTQHRMAVRIEDAGFEIRDMIAWVYGSGFPKSHDVSKAIDKAAGAEREVVGTKVRKGGDMRSGNLKATDRPDSMEILTTPATDAARQWQGWGTALKPALEPITVARKPLIGTVAENVLAHRTGALNIDGCRVGTEERTLIEKMPQRHSGTWGSGAFAHSGTSAGTTTAGRWPANLIHDGSDEVVGLFPQAGGGFGVRGAGPTDNRTSYAMAGQGQTVGYGDSGSAARFFYCAKASKKDRDEGCEGLEERASSKVGQTVWTNECQGCGKSRPQTENRCGSCGGELAKAERDSPQARNHHPTVKPTALMRYLCRLVTPPNGIVLDPFMGSGSTGKAAMLEGFQFVGIEREAEYIEIAKARIEKAKVEKESALL
jgi:DNA modification methylase